MDTFNIVNEAWAWNGKEHNDLFKGQFYTCWFGANSTHHTKTFQIPDKMATILYKTIPKLYQFIIQKQTNQVFAYSLFRSWLYAYLGGVVTVSFESTWKISLETLGRTWWGSPISTIWPCSMKMTWNEILVYRHVK